MNKQEEWIKWEAVTGLSQKYDIKSVHDDFDGLTIVFSDKKNKKKEIHVIFDGWIACYRSADETYMDHRVRNLFSKYGSNFFCDWTFFKVINSEYLQYISETSGTISDHTPLIQFAFFTDDSIFEILVAYEPKIEFVDVP